MWGTRSETKNVNSLRSAERAVRYEIERQAAVLDAGLPVALETRHFHEDSGVTTAGRSKEEAQDYRYFPEPDLVPVAPSREWVEQIRAALPELPSARRARLEAEWGLSDRDFAAIHNAGAVDLVARTVEAGASPADARKWWLNELVRRANESGTELAELPITPADVARVTALVASGELNDKLARQVIEGVLAGEGTPDEVVAARGLAIVSDEGALTAAVDEAIAAHPDVAGWVRSSPAGHRGGWPVRGRPTRWWPPRLAIVSDEGALTAAVDEAIAAPRKCAEGARRQGRRRPGAGRRGHEGHPRPGRRRPRPGADPGPPRPGLARPRPRMRHASPWPPSRPRTLPAICARDIRDHGGPAVPLRGAPRPDGEVEGAVLGADHGSRGGRTAARFRRTPPRWSSTCRRSSPHSPRSRP